MYRIDDHYTNPLLDPWYYLGPKRRKLLERGWAGVFRTYLFDELPLAEIEKRFHDSMGRPSKELCAMLGVLVLQQLFDLTDEQTVEAFALHVAWHYALDIRDESDGSMYVCERTLREYRNRAVDSKTDEILFRSLTDKLLKAFRVPTGKQRLDSTHLLSNMKRLSRLDLFVRTIEKFLKELHRTHPRILQSQVDGELAARYRDEKKGCFSRVSGEEVKKTLPAVAEDLLALVRTFESHAKVSRLDSFGLLQRVLAEQCIVRGAAPEEKVELKDPKEVGGASLQNPSDADATYDGHKGQGYQVQLMETYQEREETDPTQPNLITYAQVEAAHCNDGEAVLPAIAETQERGCAPEELLADAAYGSDENVQKSLGEGTQLTAPTMGQPKKKAEMLVLDDFRTDEEGAIISCPAGESPVQTQIGKRGTHTARFDARTCRRCEHRDYCQVGRGETGYRLRYTAKELRLADRRVAEETEAFREKYRWRSGIEALNAKLKRMMGMGRLRVRGLGRVRHAVLLKVLGWNIWQAARAVQARISAVWQRAILWSRRKLHRGSGIHGYARTTGAVPPDTTAHCLPLAA